MSDVVGYKGLLKPVDLEGLTVEEYAKRLVTDESALRFYDSYLEYLTEEEVDYLYDEYAEILYKIEKEEFDYQSHVEVRKNADESLSSTTIFYNGGTNLNEMLNDGLEEL